MFNKVDGIVHLLVETLAVQLSLSALKLTERCGEQ